MQTTAVSIDTLKTKAKALAAELHANDPEFTLHFVIHAQGQIQSAFHIAEELFLSHPAGRIATSIGARAFAPHEPSMFHGLCIKQKTGLFGFDPQTVYLGVVSINADSYKTEPEAVADLYRQAWHALELLSLTRANPPEKIPDRPVNIKRNIIGETRIHLRADLFSVFFMHTDGHGSILKEMARMRATAVLKHALHATPDRYALPMVTEAARFAIENILPQMDREKSRLKRITQISLELADSLTDHQIKLWHRLCAMAQEMAWTGSASGAILGAAIHTSDDSYLRSIMHTISELAEIEPLELDQIRAVYNPYIEIDGNRPSHDALVNLHFERALQKSLETGTPRALFERAEAQNLELMHGRFMGWCANALQAAAHVLVRSDNPNITPAQAARIEFEGQSHLPSLAVLHRFTSEITDLRRQGQTITLDMLVDLARASNDLELVARSIEYTIAHRFNDTTTVTPEHEKTDSLDEIDLTLSPNLGNISIRQENGEGPTRHTPIPGGAPNTPAPEFALED
jgi:hypothetical protein